ncbi:MAG: EI24 domain-containing protein [Bacteroidota bacterium]
MLITRNLQLFWVGLASYFRAFFFIIRHGFIFYLIIPFVLLFIIYRYGYILQKNVFEAKLDTINSLIWYLIYGLVEVTIGMVLMYFAKYMVVAILSPLLTYISEKTERILTKEKQDFSWSQFKEDVVRALKLMIRNLMWYYIYFLFIQLIAFIFWEKPSESPLQWIVILIASYYYGFSFLDYVNERRRRNVSESIIFIRKNCGLAISIGLIYYLMIFVPVDLRIFFEYTLTIENTYELVRQLSWWVLAASAPIFGIVSATLAMYEIDKPNSQK